jgi:hypothetical protein
MSFSETVCFYHFYFFAYRKLPSSPSNKALAPPRAKPSGRSSMIDRRPFDRLGGANHGWLDAKHHFSFAGYYDPKKMHWGAPARLER